MSFFFLYHPMSYWWLPAPVEVNKKAKIKKVVLTKEEKDEILLRKNRQREEDEIFEMMLLNLKL